jgi:hypothetical protein
MTGGLTACPQNSGAVRAVSDGVGNSAVGRGVGGYSAGAQLPTESTPSPAGTQCDDGLDHMGEHTGVVDANDSQSGHGDHSRGHGGGSDAHGDTNNIDMLLIACCDAAGAVPSASSADGVGDSPVGDGGDNGVDGEDDYVDDDDEVPIEASMVFRDHSAGDPDAVRLRVIAETVKTAKEGGKPEAGVVTSYNGTTPINEYTRNGTLLLTTFSTLFLLGQGVPKNGPVSASHARHIVMQAYRPDFARDNRLLFLLFNQAQRQAACAVVAAKAKADPTHMAKFIALVSQPGFKRAWKRLLRTPNPRSPRTCWAPFCP